jgi:hypothetical protein
MIAIFSFLLWLGFCAAVATAANTRGRSPIGWFLLAFFITPLLAIFFLLALPKDPETRWRLTRSHIEGALLIAALAAVILVQNVAPQLLDHW